MNAISSITIYSGRGYTADHIFVNNRQTGTKTPIQTVEKVTAAAGNGSNYVRQRYGISPTMVIIV